VGVDMPQKCGHCGWDGLAGLSGRILGSIEINRSISAGEHSVTPRFVLRMKKLSKQEQNSAALWEWGARGVAWRTALFGQQRERRPLSTIGCRAAVRCSRQAGAKL
jgi:hypothetical protein